jgi:hypothetical protein
MESINIDGNINKLANHYLEYNLLPIVIAVELFGGLLGECKWREMAC